MFIRVRVLYMINYRVHVYKFHDIGASLKSVSVSVLWNLSLTVERLLAVQKVAGSNLSRFASSNSLRQAAHTQRHRQIDIRHACSSKMNSVSDLFQSLQINWFLDIHAVKSLVLLNARINVSFQETLEFLLASIDVYIRTPDHQLRGTATGCPTKFTACHILHIYRTVPLHTAQYRQMAHFTNIHELPGSSMTRKLLAHSTYLRSEPKQHDTCRWIIKLMKIHTSKNCTVYKFHNIGASLKSVSVL